MYEASDGRLEPDFGNIKRFAWKSSTEETASATLILPGVTGMSNPFCLSAKVKLKGVSSY